MGLESTHLTQICTELFEKLTDARFINRLFGFPAMIQWFNSIKLAKGVSLATDSDVESVLSKIMAGSMLLYYPLEHMWWLTTLKSGKRIEELLQRMNLNGSKLSLWSLRAWLIYVIADIIKTNLALKQLRQRARESGADPNAQYMEKRLKWWLQACFCDLILAIQYSVENGPFSDNVLNLAGLYGGIVNLYVKLYILPKIKSA